jgi:SAM-dependent methyltransferase
VADQQNGPEIGEGCGAVSASRLQEIFLDVQRGLPRQGPGCAEATRRALGLCAGLAAAPAILDIGCGPGMQTLVLAEALNGPVTAVDMQAEYLDELMARATAAGCAARITPLRADMAALGLPGESFDLLWSEGAAYVMGVENALRAWKGLLRPGGYIGFSELVWLEEPSGDAAAFFRQEYPAMGSVPANISLIERSGYEVAGHFTLPDSAWWDDYYTPLEAKLPKLREKYRGDEEALGLIGMTAREIAMRRACPQAYGYEFFVARAGAA